MPGKRIQKNKQSYHDPNKKREKRFAFDAGKRRTGSAIICRYCNAIYEEKKWRDFGDLEAKFIDRLKKSVCPACHEEKNHVSDGVLHVTGDFLRNHGKEIVGIILNTEAQEMRRDILNRVERIESSAEEITVYTGKNQLAVEIGKRIDRAYKGGDLKIKWSKRDKPVDVYWHKDEAEE